MHKACDGDAAIEAEDGLLRHLKEEQQQVRQRTRRLLKDYRQFFEEGPASPAGALFPRREFLDLA